MSKEALASIILELKAFEINREKPFQLASGKVSPIYFDCRKLISNRTAMTTIVGMWAWQVSKLNPAFCVGGESAGIPFAGALAHAMGYQQLYARKQTKKYGTKGKLEGLPFHIDNKTAILVEDMITDGGSKLQFVSAIRSADLDCNHCFVVLDREQGGKVLLYEHNVELHSLITAREVIELGLNSGIISLEDYRVAYNALTQ